MFGCTNSGRLLSPRCNVRIMANELRIHLRQVSESASEASIGRHQVPIDRPASKGGTDAGPMGGELFLAAIGGCFMSNLLAAIKARQAAISEVVVEVAGYLAGSPIRFTGVELRIAAKCGDAELRAGWAARPAVLPLP